jgi:pimeloyl-ACP methyl ester carboxylesterase
MKPDFVTDRPVQHGVFAGTSYSVCGDGTPVVLIHGVGMNRTVWAPQVEALCQGVRVVTYDMLGHGGSTLPPATPVLEDYALQLAGLLDGLQIDAAHIVGHSMGALVALEFALRYPARALSVVTLIAVYDRTPGQREAVMQRAAALDGALRAGLPADAGQHDPSIDATMARWFDDPVPAHLASVAGLVRSLLRSVNPLGYARTYQLFASSDAAHVGRLPQLSMPALFMTGECDPNSSPAMSHAMAAAAPRARAEVVANERHMMNVTAPDIVNRALLQFIRQAGQAARQP